MAVLDPSTTECVVKLRRTLAKEAEATLEDKAMLDDEADPDDNYEAGFHDGRAAGRQLEKEARGDLIAKAYQEGWDDGWRSRDREISNYDEGWSAKAHEDQAREE